MTPTVRLFLCVWLLLGVWMLSHPARADGWRVWRCAGVAPSVVEYRGTPCTDGGEVLPRQMVETNYWQWDRPKAPERVPEPVRASNSVANVGVDRDRAALGAK